MIYFTHMSGIWLNFAVMFFVQVLLFLFHAHHEKKLTDVPRILLFGAISGLVAGPLFDLIGTYPQRSTWLQFICLQRSAYAASAIIALLHVDVDGYGSFRDYGPLFPHMDIFIYSSINRVRDHSFPWSFGTRDRHCSSVARIVQIPICLH
jgi:hypothetical protein